MVVCIPMCIVACMIWCMAVCMSAQKDVCIGGCMRKCIYVSGCRQTHVRIYMFSLAYVCPSVYIRARLYKFMSVTVFGCVYVCDCV